MHYQFGMITSSDARPHMGQGGKRLLDITLVISVDNCKVGNARWFAPCLGPAGGKARTWPGRGAIHTDAFHAGRIALLVIQRSLYNARYTTADVQHTLHVYTRSGGGEMWAVCPCFPSIPTLHNPWQCYPSVPPHTIRMGCGTVRL